MTRWTTSTEHLDALDDLSAPTGLAATDTDPTAATDDGGGDDDAEDDEGDAPEDGTPLDAATAARQVMDPGSVTFSSGGKKKRRGLFG